MLDAMCRSAVLMVRFEAGSERFLERPFACIEAGVMPRHIETLTSRSGSPSLVVDGVSYHSPYDPIRESSRFFNSLNLEGADIIFQFGWGLGYASEALRTRCKPSARILVLEPDDELLSLSRSCFPDDPAWQDSRFHFVSGRQVCRFFSHNPPFACQETDNILWVEWPATVQLHKPMLEDLKKTFRTELRDRAANLLTHFQNGRMYFENVVRNFRYQGDTDAGQLFGKFKGRPVVIVSAGPSLDRNIRELQGIESRCFLVAVDTALRPLLEMGIVPHAVIIADPQKLNAKHIVGAMPKKTFLIAEQGVHFSALATASRRFLFGLGLFPDPLFAKFGFRRTSLNVWGSVATAALDFACKVEAGTIIFTGQDFAFSWNRSYASHTIFGDTPAESTGIFESDLWNQAIPTTENLVAYRDFFVRRMKAEPHIRFINATEGGILTQGAELLTLRDALHQCCKQPMNTESMLESCHRPQPVTTEALDHLQRVLRREIEDSISLSAFLDLVAKEAVLKQDRDGVKEAIAWGLTVIGER
jgi:hypothetical protein